MHDFPTRPPVRRMAPRAPAATAPRPRPRSDLVEVFAALLPGVVVTPATFRSETALAGQLRVDPRRIREIRSAHLVAPARAGRGWVYGPADIRTLSVMLALLRLGATLHELEAFFEVVRHDGDHDHRPARTPTALCAAFCERLAARMEEEIERLGALDDLFDPPSPARRDDLAERLGPPEETIVK